MYVLMSVCSYMYVYMYLFALACVYISLLAVACVYIRRCAHVHVYRCSLCVKLYMCVYVTGPAIINHVRT